MSEGRIKKVKIITGGTTIQGATVPSSGTVINEVFHDNTLKGTGQPSNELGIAESVLQDIASKVSDVQVNGESVVSEGVADITVGDATITIQKNGTDIDSFTANETTDKTINVEVPTTLRELSTVAEQAVLDSGITSADVEQITINKNDIATASGEINTINSKIPAQASAENKLADKNFVNSSIATNTANFIGTFNSVAELESYSGTVTNNDYAFVVSEDSAGNTVYNRYKYTTATTPASWVFEYELNNSSFTSDQWAAINSGATTTNIGQIATNTSTISGHIADKNNPHQVTKSQIGLGNCDNTSDADKPISTATQAALNLKANDADVVHKTGNESIAGNKTFTGSTTVNYFNVNPTNTSPTSKEGGEIKFLDAPGEINAGKAMFIDRYDGILRFFGYDSNGTVNVPLRADVEHNVAYCATPTEDTTGSIQIDTVGARNTKLQNYSLDANVVHKTGNETVGGEKTFSNAAWFNSNANFRSGMYLINSSYGLFDATAASKHFDFSEKNGKNSAWLENRINDSGVAGANRLNVWVRTYTDNTYSTAVDSVISLIAKPDGTKYATAPAPTENTTSSIQIDTVGARNTNIRDFAYQYVTNCITEIPQNIKITLSANKKSVFVESGAIMYYPDGFEQDGTTRKFTQITTSAQKQVNTGGLTNVIVPIVFRYNQSSGSGVFWANITLDKCFSSSTAPANGSEWYDTTNNIEGYVTGGTISTNDRSTFPIGLLTIDAEGVVTNVQIFNGFGFIGTTAFALPGLKVLVPDGFNEDGTLKNRIGTVSTRPLIISGDSQARTISLYSTYGLGGFYGKPYSQEEYPGNNYRYWYKPSENKVYNSGTSEANITQSLSCWLFYFNPTTGEFITNKIFRAIDYNDTDFIAHQAMPSQRYADLTLPTSGQTVTAPADGYITVLKAASADGQYITMINNTNGANISMFSTENLLNLRLLMPVSKGDVITINYTAGGGTSVFRLIYANGVK